MESYLEPAQIAPEPIAIEKYLSSPVVPEVSMISNTKTSIDNFSLEENVWKVKKDMQQHSENHFIPVGYMNLQAQFAKKQVRFENPELQLTSVSQEPTHSKNMDSCNSGQNMNYHNFSAIRKQNINNNSSNIKKPFEEIYMANIPDRKLDLSLIDVPHVTTNMQNMEIVENNASNKNVHIPENEISNNLKKADYQESDHRDKQVENKENVIPKSYQHFLELQKKINSKRKLHNDSVTDIFNYKRNNAITKKGIFPAEPLQVERPTYPTTTDVKQQYDQYFNRGYLKHQEYLPRSYSSNTYKQKIDQNEQSIPNLEPSRPYITSNKHLEKQKSDCETQTSFEDLTESKALENVKNCEPNNTDLLKIIAQQNEQLLILQKQVAMLLERDRQYSKSLEGPSVQDRKDPDVKKYATMSTPQKNHFRQENTITKQASIFQDNQRKWGMSKFSINLTTSFDMPLRAQQKQNFVNNEPKIQEITESDFSPKNDHHLDHSLHFQEPLNVREQCPSPQPSININMNDYESSDEEVPASEIGATFYNNLMGQVNNILKKTQRETDDLSRKGSSLDNEIKRNQALYKVKEATLKHLKNIGINVDNEQDFIPSDNIRHCSPSEISLTVKQLLMKYLPPDHVRPPEKIPISNEAFGGILEQRPEFSMASLEYMKKYNLISSKDKIPPIVRPQKIDQKECNYINNNNKRILDLTALKMQPKLL